MQARLALRQLRLLLPPWLPLSLSMGSTQRPLTGARCQVCWVHFGRLQLGLVVQCPSVAAWRLLVAARLCSS